MLQQMNETGEQQVTNSRRMPNPKALLTGLASSVGVGIALGKLTRGPFNRQVNGFDKRLMDATNEAKSPVLDPIMTVLSALGEPWMLYPVSGLVAARWLTQKKVDECLTVALAILGSAGIDKAIKTVVKRPRPLVRLPLPRSRYSGSSFPSNHAMMSLATYATMVYLFTRPQEPGDRKGQAAEVTGKRETGAQQDSLEQSERIEEESKQSDQGGVERKNGQSKNARRKPSRMGLLLPALLCGLIGWSRVYQGVHNPSDVLAGWAVAGIWIRSCTATTRAKTGVA